MLSDYLQKLKAKCGYTWAEIEERSGIPEKTAKKVIKGETETPRIDTVIALVYALGGDLNSIVDNDDVKISKDAFALVKSYELRLSDKDELIKQLRKEKHDAILWVIILGLFIVAMLIADLLIGSRGWLLLK